MITSTPGKLFASVISNRLNKAIVEKASISPCQIGFMKHRRAPDHIFVLKAITEEAKSKKLPIFAFFVDLKKTFDTVWRVGLYYKLLSEYNISDKCVCILHDMYSA